MEVIEGSAARSQMLLFHGEEEMGSSPSDIGVLNGFVP